MADSNRVEQGRELLPARRFEWERVVRRLKMRRGLKLVAMTLASYASNDGSKARPGRERLANVCGLTPRAVSNSLVELRELGVIERISEGSRYGRQARADEYRLTLPSDILDAIPMLDPDDGSGEVGVTRSEREQVKRASRARPGTGEVGRQEQVKFGTEQVKSQTRTGEVGFTPQVQDKAIYTTQDRTRVVASVTSGASGLDSTDTDQTMAEWEREVADTWSPSPPCECREGWLGYDKDARPIPCPRCKPHLRPVPNEGVA